MNQCSISYQVLGDGVDDEFSATIYIDSFEFDTDPIATKQAFKIKLPDFLKHNRHRWAAVYAVKSNKDFFKFDTAACCEYPEVDGYVLEEAETIKLALDRANLDYLGYDHEFDNLFLIDLHDMTISAWRFDKDGYPTQRYASEKVGDWIYENEQEIIDDDWLPHFVEANIDGYEDQIMKIKADSINNAFEDGSITRQDRQNQLRDLLSGE